VIKKQAKSIARMCQQPRDPNLQLPSLPGILQIFYPHRKRFATNNCCRFAFAGVPTDENIPADVTVKENATLSPKLSEIIDALEAIAPTRHAELWDNVGLLAGDPMQDIRSAILTIDYTAEVAAEARAAKSDLIIAYHPPIFSAIKRLTAGHLVFDAIRRGVAIYSPHTAWDVAAGGTNDFLADLMGVGERSPLRLAEAKSTQHKLVTFVPQEHVDKVAGALFAAGAGRIGQYSSCSFQSPGTGTFFGEQGTHPSVGSSGKLEKVSEIRLETIVPNSAIEAVIRALRTSHPYEEPAFDLNVLSAAPQGVGLGRIGTIASTPRVQLLDRIKRGLNLDHLLVAGPTDAHAQTIACCAGACGDLLNDAISRKVDLYLTGEIRHHDALRAAATGMTVVCTLHSNSERASLTRLGDRLRERVPGLVLQLSQSDRDPFLIR
jgi:dinuclear metal center YbgI/SA1388 family protein